MKLDHTPHPLVEDHYHVRELIEGQEKRSEERLHHQTIEKNRDQILKTIATFKEIELLDFWCNQCEKDFIARARKQIDSWQTIAYYKTKHKCGTWCVRHITDRFKDVYFFCSRKVAYDRGVNYNDWVQPHQSGFNTLYGKR